MKRQILSNKEDAINVDSITVDCDDVRVERPNIIRAIFFLPFTLLSLMVYAVLTLLAAIFLRPPSDKKILRKNIR